MRRVEGGFTLLELMVTVVIIVLLAMMAVPSLSTLIEKSRLKGVADDVVNLYATARLEAVKQGRNVNVALGGTSPAWCVGANRAPDPTVGQPQPGAAACDCTSPTSCVLETAGTSTIASVVTPATNSGVTSATSGSTTDITFNGQLGTLTPITTSPAVVTLSSSTGRYALQINVSPLGQVYACTPSNSAFISGYPSC